MIKAITGYGASVWRKITLLVWFALSLSVISFASMREADEPLSGCQYSIALYDSFGDGWNGCKLDVFVDGSLVLDDITLSLGYGPAFFYFTVNSGAQITTAFSTGSYPCEPYYYLYDSYGMQVFYVPNNCNPVINAGQLFADCPETGTAEGYVFNYDGLAVSGAVVGIAGGAFTTSGPDGHYLLEPIASGNIEISCGKQGYNTSVDSVMIITGDTTTHDFTLTQPNIVVNPLSIDRILNPNEYFTTSVSILNNGSGPVDWTADVEFLSQPLISCEYSVRLYDAYGDGWNGCALDVLVNGQVVLDNITLNGGFGPSTFYFDVTSGDEITTIFTPASWIGEPYYYIDDSQGNQVWYSPTGNSGPPNILPGQLIASCGGGDWLTLDLYSGSVNPFGGVGNVPAHLNAINTSPGEQYNAEIVISSSPNVGTITIPVSMLVMGDTLIPPENLEVELADDVSGQVSLAWEWNGEDFQFFMVRRDGVIIGTTINTAFSDILPDFGQYCYTVQAVYDEGATVPAGPGCVEWPNPELTVDPNDLHGWVWEGFTVDVFSSLYNNGEGTLSFAFPEFTAINLLRDPVVPHNLPGAPYNLREVDIRKGDDRLNGTGYPIVLGAGGPDGFGYIWVDSDENGGPSFNWTDISTTGAIVSGLADDNVVGPFNIGFSFPFYGEDKTQFWINSNGTVGFTSNYISLGNTSIPTGSSTYKDFVAWMWDDLVYRSGQSMVFYQNFTDRMIIQFNNYGRYGQPGGVWAQVIFYKNGKLMILYDQLDETLSFNSCTVGIQSSTPSVGLQVVYNNTFLHNDLAILFSQPADFIIAVDPTWGTVPAGEVQPITVTYDSEGYDPGPYTQDLLLESNDPENLEWIIYNTMHVYTPAFYTGYVIDNDSEEPLPGVTVAAGVYQALTDDEGYYELYVDEGEYDVSFIKPGYLDITVPDTFALAGEPTHISIGMWDRNNAPAFVLAEVQDGDTWCKVTWALPAGPYEISMDDGEADDFFVYAHSGSWNAVKFTPAGYPATVIGGKFFVGDDSFPGPFLGTEFGVAVFDDDGTSGLPGTMLDSTGVTVNNYGWVSLDWLNAEITSGSFYLAIFQSENFPLTAPLGVDLDHPTYYKSYSKFQANLWTLSAFQDFMIRAWVSGPEGDAMSDATGENWKATPRVPLDWNNHAITRSGLLPRILPGEERFDVYLRGIEGMNNRDVVSYMVARYSDFDPEGSPAAGTLAELSTLTGQEFDDYEWSDLPQGWYAYGVKALYTSGLYSEYSLSGIAGHLMDHRVTVNITLSTGAEPAGVEITLQGLDYPHETYILTTSASGTVTFDPVWQGQYDLSAFKVGYDTYIINSADINEDKTFDILLDEKRYAPKCLDVDPLTLDANWCRPLRTALDEKFESPEFPPEGWQSVHDPNVRGWFRTGDGSLPGWTIPSWDSFYACSIGDQGSTGSGCCDYLITPPMDLRESEGYALFFDSYYDGAYGQLARVEYSLDAGSTWELLSQLDPDTSWVEVAVDLSQFSGPGGEPRLWLAFNADYQGIPESGWAIDNIRVMVPVPPAGYIDYYVFLDDAFIGSTTDTIWNFAPLSYGVEYTASVAARYTSGLSDKDYDRFICKFLYPPRNLTGEAPDNAAILEWDPPQEGISEREHVQLENVPDNLLGYNIYRNGIFVSYQDHVGSYEEPITQSTTDENLEPGIYDYTVTGVYDLEEFGFPGETGESMTEGPAEVTVDYCFDLEFKETWVQGSFEVNKWKVEGENWKINGQLGKPAPSAEFTWDPVKTGYDLSLESYPICAAGMTEGRIWLDYAVKLETFHVTGEEKLFAEVWGWDTQEWKPVAEYSNLEGSFVWADEHIDIGPLAMDKIFKIRFRANGANSLNIIGWFLDNIHIYRTCDGPSNLVASVNYEEGIELNWDPPASLTPQGYVNSREEGSPSDAGRALTGYNIYRSFEGKEYQWIGFTAETNYVDPKLELGLYCYKVSATWVSATDECESDFTSESCDLVTGIGDLANFDGELLVYPNPANDHLLLKSVMEMVRISFYNAQGILLRDKLVNCFQMDMNTAGYIPGVYLLRVETLSGTFSKTITIQR